MQQKKLKLLINQIFLSVVICVFALIAQSCENGTDATSYIVGRTTRTVWDSAVGLRGYADYSPDSAFVRAIKDSMSRHTGIRFTLYSSPWCGTCVRNTPQILKTLDAIGYPDSLLLFVALDTDKSDPEGLARKDAVYTVSALIIKNNGAEIGRITDAYMPWEKAIALILEKIK